MNHARSIRHQSSALGFYMGLDATSLVDRGKLMQRGVMVHRISNYNSSTIPRKFKLLRENRKKYIRGEFLIEN